MRSWPTRWGGRFKQQKQFWDRSEWFWVQTFTWHVGPTVHLLLPGFPKPVFLNVPSDLPQKTLVNEKQKRQKTLCRPNRGLIFFIGLIWHDGLSLALVSPGSWTHRAAQSDATDGAREYAFGEWHPVELLCRLYSQVWFCVKIILCQFGRSNWYNLYFRMKLDF